MGLVLLSEANALCVSVLALLTDRLMTVRSNQDVVHSPYLKGASGRLHWPCRKLRAGAEIDKSYGSEGQEDAISAAGLSQKSRRLSKTCGSLDFFESTTDLSV